MESQDQPRLLIGIIVVVGVAAFAALCVWLATSESGAEAPTPRILTPAELQATATKLGHPIYWAGPVPGKDLEAIETSDDSVEVRYVGEGVEPGKGTAETGQTIGDVLTVTSYPLPDPAKALDALAEGPGALVRHTHDGLAVVSSDHNPTNAYFASPDNSVQVKVHDPSPRQAMALALSGSVRPAGCPPPAGPSGPLRPAPNC